MYKVNAVMLRCLRLLHYATAFACRASSAAERPARPASFDVHATKYIIAAFNDNNMSNIYIYIHTYIHTYICIHMRLPGARAGAPRSSKPAPSSAPVSFVRNF